MKLGYFLSLSAFLLIPVQSVTISDFPQCAQDCIASTATPLGGNANDLDFICKSPARLDPVHACEFKTCSPSDLNRLFPLAIQLCEPVGGTIAAGLANLSSCAQPGLAIATAESGCSPTDWTCICTNSAFTIIAAQYEEQYCSPADRRAIVTYTSSACAAVGVQLQRSVPNPPSGASSPASSSPAPSSSAQSIYTLPQCAQPCIDAALVQSGCQPSDWNCICVNPAFTSGATAFCELEACSVDDQNRILNITGAQCSAIGEALVPATTISRSLGTGTAVSNPLDAATVPLVYPTGSVPGAVPQFSNLPECAQFCATNATTKSGGSVTDLSFLCTNGPVLVSIGACESALCSPTDQQTSLVLSQKLCEPVGGVASINPIINPSAQASVISAAYPTTNAVNSLSDVPSCAKPCLVTAFRESGCALDDIQCQCTSNVFSNLFAGCQAAVCGTLDLQRLLPFTIKRCGSVGISIPSSVLTIESDLAYQIPTSTYTLPTPTDLTNAPIDVADLPFCVQECIYQAAAFGNCDIHNRTCICTSEEFSAYANVCQTALCTADELQVLRPYAMALCQPVPGHLTADPTGTLLSSYLAEPTPTAPDPPSITNTPNNVAALPLCGQPCVYSAAARANCSSINDLTCICKNPTFLSIVGNCDEANCNEAEQAGMSSPSTNNSNPAFITALIGYAEIMAFSENLCKPAGGVSFSFTANYTLASPTGGSPPKVTSFTGDASILRSHILDCILGVLMWFVWAL